MPTRKKSPKKKGSPKKGKRQPRYDWAKIRIAREVGGASFADLSREYGPQPHTISLHAKKEAWRDPIEVAAESSAAAAEKIREDSLVFEAPAIRASLTKKRSLADRLLGLASTHIKRLESGERLVLTTGNVVTQEDPIQSLRRLGMVLSSVEVVDKSLIGLANGFRSKPLDSVESPESSEGAILDATEALPGD